MVNPTMAARIIYIGRHNLSVVDSVCKPGLLIPVWQADDNLQSIIIVGLVYFLTLCYTFVGVSLIADRFMAAIEVITSQERNVIVTSKRTGVREVHSVRIWNETVANLTLMALGSSAPEIFLAIIEIYGNKFEAGDLGPGTIVGAAAFNMFIIIAVCVFVPGSDKIKKIRNIRVFCVTLTFSLIAYLWLLFILVYWTPGVITVLEGVATFMFFPVAVLTAYLADIRFRVFKCCSNDYLNDSKRNRKSSDEIEFEEESKIDNQIDVDNDPVDTASLSCCKIPSWKDQFINAFRVPTVEVQENNQIDEEMLIRRVENKPSITSYIVHYLTVFWKLFFAFVPPPNIWNGWACFVVSMALIGLLTAIIGDLASQMGCNIRLKDSVTAITIVALGTSIPDLFASKIAAENDKYADPSIGNVTGSNAVNVFLGIGVAWTMAAIYHQYHGTTFNVKPGSLGFSVTLFCILALLCATVLLLKRKLTGGELGGKLKYRLSVALFFGALWIFYLVISSLQVYGYIKGF